jgi:hypothetical protein
MDQGLIKAIAPGVGMGWGLAVIFAVMAIRHHRNELAE